MPDPSFIVTVPGMHWAATFRPGKCATHAEAAALFRQTMPACALYEIRVHRKGDARNQDQRFPATSEVAA